MASNSDMYGVDKSNVLEGSYQVDEDLSIPVYANVQLFPCSICGRNFNGETLVKAKFRPFVLVEKRTKSIRTLFLRENINRFARNRRRKSLERRLMPVNKELQIPMFLTWRQNKRLRFRRFFFRETTNRFSTEVFLHFQFYTEGVKPKQETTKQKPHDWRENHESLVRTIRQARQVTRAIETGAPLPKYAPSQVPSDYVQCEFCQRNFNKHAAERHIPLLREKLVRQEK